MDIWELQDLSLSPVSGLGPEIVDGEGLNGPLLPKKTLEKVGGFAPHLFQWVLRWEGAIETPQIDDFRPLARNRG